MADAPDRYLAALQGLRDGLTTREAAAHAGITRTALTKRRGLDPDYQDAWDSALSAGQVNKSRRRARGSRRAVKVPEPPPTVVVDAEVVGLTLAKEADEDAERAAPGLSLTVNGWLETQVQIFENEEEHPLLRAAAQRIISKYLLDPITAERVRLAKAAPIDGDGPERVRYELPASPMRQDD